MIKVDRDVGAPECKQVSVHIRSLVSSLITTVWTIPVRSRSCVVTEISTVFYWVIDSSPHSFASSNLTFQCKVSSPISYWAASALDILVSILVLRLRRWGPHPCKKLLRNFLSCLLIPLNSFINNFMTQNCCILCYTLVGRRNKQCWERRKRSRHGIHWTVLQDIALQRVQLVSRRRLSKAESTRTT